MFYTLDRTEDGLIAVLVDDEGKITDVPLHELPKNDGIGSVFKKEGNIFIFCTSETDVRRKRINDKRKKLFNRIMKEKSVD